jgi:hypothetical protein
MKNNRFFIAAAAFMVLAGFFTACGNPAGDGDKTDAATPTFDTDLSSSDNRTYQEDASPVNALTVAATSSDSGAITYQWYKLTEEPSDQSKPSGGEAITDKTSASYTPDVSATGTT